MQDRSESTLSFFENIEKLARENKYVWALYLVEEALSQNPSDEGLQGLKYILLMQAGNYRGALDIIESIIPAKPQLLAHHLNHKAYCLYELGEFKLAQSAIKENLLKSPDLIEAKCLSGLILLKLRKTVTAKKILESIVLEPLINQDEYSVALYANVLCALGEYPAALNLLESHNENFACLWIARGDANFGLQRYKDASICYSQAIKINPNAADAYLGLGKTFAALQQYKESYAQYELAINLRPYDVDIQDGKNKISALLKSEKPAKVKEQKPLEKPKDFAEIDVPNDNNCLFWSFIMAYLLPTLQSPADFDQAFKTIVGNGKSVNQQTLRDEKIKNVVYQLLKQYDFEKNSSIYDNSYFVLLCKVLRHRTVKEMTSFFSKEHQQVIADDVNKVNWNNYARWMKKNTAWGGQAEIMAMSNLTKTSIKVYSKGYNMDYLYDGSQQNISLVYTNVTNKLNPGNHYHYLISEDLQKKIREIRVVKQSAAPTMFKPKEQTAEIRENNRVFNILDFCF